MSDITATTAYIIACEAVALAAATAFSAAEAIRPRTFPAALRTAADALEADICVLAQTEVSWSGADDRGRALTELSAAALDLTAALDCLAGVSRDRNEMLARLMPSATRIRRALDQIARDRRALAHRGGNVVDLVDLVAMAA